VKAFPALPSHSQRKQLQHKNAVPSLLNSDEGRVKNQLEPGQESMGDSTVLSRCFAKKSLAKIDRYAAALLRRRNKLLVLHFGRGGVSF